jgi:hypothetical protein
MEQSTSKKFQQFERTNSNLSISLSIHFSHRREKDNKPTNSLRQFNSLLQYKVPAVKKILNKVEKLKTQINHIPGIFNTETDTLSHLELSGDYSIKYHPLKQALQTLHLQPEIDLFASSTNHRLPLYGSLRECRKPSLRNRNMGDAFHFNWRNIKALIHPPIPLLTKVIQKIVGEKGGHSALIVPNWPGQVWSPLLDQISIEKINLGPLNSVLSPGPKMLRKELHLPPGDMVLHLIQAA